MSVVIQSGTILTAADTFQADILIEGEQIKLIGKDLAIPAGAQVIDANGKYYYSEPIELSVIKDIQNPQLEYVIGPNPTSDHLNVIFTNLDGIYDFEFKVVSMNGIVEKIVQVTPEESTITVDVSDLRNGGYILQLTSSGKEVSSKKFIKK